MELGAVIEQLRASEPLMLRAPLAIEQPLAAPTLATVDVYGAPAYGPLKGRPEGVVIHTPENQGPDLASAIGIARWQASPSNTSGGSYHGILAHDAARGPMSDPAAWVMVRSVPWNMACGGLMSGRDPAVWAPSRYPWIAANLSPAAYSDPNAWLHQLALSGRAAWWSSSAPDAALMTLARWLLVLEQAYSYDALVMEHRHWQINRTDPATPVGLIADGVVAAYQAELAPAPTPTPTPAPAPSDTRAAALARILASTGTLAAAEQELAQAQSAMAALRRSIEYAKGLAS